MALYVNIDQTGEMYKICKTGVEWRQRIKWWNYIENNKILKQ